MKNFCSATWLLFLVTARSAFAAEPLPRAHAHNDYEHARPLLDALDQGFCSVEADVWLVDGQLLVAHDRDKVQPGRTLQRLYLDPLRERVRANRGQVHPKPSEFTLLVDFKSEAEPTYRKLREVLADYREMLTRFSPTNTLRGAVTVILSGNRPIETVAAEPERLCAIDGRLPDLDTNPSVHLVPLISSSWRPTFNWFTDGKLPEADRTKLRELVTKAHTQGRRIRFWGAEDQPFVWREQFLAGVDLINTDKLAELAKVLRELSVDGANAKASPK